jgi:hypothetical protein
VRFDLRRFNDAVVKGGGVPMVTLARTIDAFIARHETAAGSLARPAPGHHFLKKICTKAAESCLHSYE